MTATMNEVINAAGALAKIAPLLGDNVYEHDYHDALALVEHLLETDENNVLVDILCQKITAYESTMPKVIAMNERLATVDSGTSMLRLLIDQHSLTLSDFENEIGKKAMVSLILNGKRQLSLDHIHKLAARFNISPALFV